MKRPLNMIANAVKYEEKLYFVSGAFDSLYSICLDTLESQLICDIFWKYKGVSTYCILHDNCVYAISMFGGQIFRYNLLNGAKMFYSIDDERVNIFARLYKNEIWIFPRVIPGEIIVFNIEQESFRKIPWGEQTIEGEILTFSVQDKSVVFILKDSNQIVSSSYPFAQMSVERRCQEKLYCVFHGKNEEYYATVDGCNEVYFFNGSDKQKIYIGKTLNVTYTRGFCIGEKLVLTVEDKFIMFDNKGNILVSVDVPTVNKQGGLFISYIDFGDKYYFLPWNAKVGLIVSKSDYNTKEYVLTFDECDIFRKNHLVISEGNQLSLKEFLDYIVGEK